MKQINTFEGFANISKNCVIKISAVWCGQCKVLEPIIKKCCEDTQTDLYSIDVDECDEHFLQSLLVKSIPVLIFYKGGCEIKRTIGLISEEEILNILNNNDSNI